MKTLQELESEFKECRYCKTHKLFEEFYKRKTSRDGLYNYCKECMMKISSLNHSKKIEDAEYYESFLEKAKIKSKERYYCDPDYKNNHEKSDIKYKNKYPERRKARDALNNEIKSGKIIKLPCQICGDDESHGHHEDYSKPLDVIWLCKTHHSEIHRKFNTIRQQLGLDK